MPKGKGPAYDLVDPEPLRPTDLDDAVHGRADGDPDHCGGHVVGSHRLEEDGWHSDNPVVRGTVGDALDELVELRRMNNRVRDAGCLDQRLLGQLRAEVAGSGRRGITALGQRLRADDRQCDVMPDACGHVRGQQVAGRGFEELEGRRVREVGRVRDVDDDRRAVKCLGQPFARDCVDAELGRGGNGLVAVLGELGDELRADASGATDDDDLQADSPSSRLGLRGRDQAARAQAGFGEGPHAVLGARA